MVGLGSGMGGMGLLSSGARGACAKIEVESKVLLNLSVLRSWVTHLARSKSSGPIHRTEAMVGFAWWGWGGGVGVALMKRDRKSLASDSSSLIALEFSHLFSLVQLF